MTEKKKRKGKGPLVSLYFLLKERKKTRKRKIYDIILSAITVVVLQHVQHTTVTVIAYAFVEN